MEEVPRVRKRRPGESVMKRPYGRERGQLRGCLPSFFRSFKKQKKKKGPRKKKGEIKGACPTCIEREPNEGKKERGAS